MRGKRLSALFGGVLILVSAASLAPADGRSPADPDFAQLELLRVRTCTGDTWFYVESPQAEMSAAWSDNTDRTDKGSNVPLSIAACELTSRVIARTDDPSPLMALARTFRDTTAVRFDPAPGFWIVTTPSVRDAIDAVDQLASDPRLAEVYLDVRRPQALREAPTDPYFSYQWHLKNDTLPIADVNAEPAWDAGFTGAGVIIGIVEGGWQYDHPDLAGNYNEEASQPGGNATAHATGCAGIAAAVANNDLGGASVAYGAQISGQLFGSDSETAAAFAFRNDLNDIKSNSWGPFDNGTISYMSSVERAALEDAIASGRGGLGEIFTWAAGNGGTRDRVDYDAFASSRFTCAIGAVGDLDTRASYNESGSSMLAVAHSSGNSRSIYTTTSNSGYTFGFGGTSAASPLAAGTIALMLEANPNLTWRDVQHVLIRSARKCDPYYGGWTTNDAGFDISYDYGFGAVDAGAAVALAEGWTNVEPEVVADTGVIEVNTEIPDNDETGVTQTAEIAEHVRIESVELILNVDSTYVGDLQIVLTAPSGTESILATQRSDSTDDYVDYIFTSLRDWGESSFGTWTVHIADLAGGDHASWIDFRLKVYGTEITDCPADLDVDGFVGQSDLGILLASYGVNDGGDIDGDGDTDLDDLSLLLGAWGQECP